MSLSESDLMSLACWPAYGLGAVSDWTEPASATMASETRRRMGEITLLPFQWPEWPVGLRICTSMSFGFMRRDAGIDWPLSEPKRAGSGMAPVHSKALVPGGCLYQPGSL